MRRIFANKNGAALPVAIMVMLVITILSGIMISSIQSEIKQSKVVEERTIARYLAEAGIDHLLYLITEHLHPFDTIDTNPITPNTLIISNEIIDAAIGSYSIQYADNTNYSRTSSVRFICIGETLNGREMKIEVMLRDVFIEDLKEIYE